MSEQLIGYVRNGKITRLSAQPAFEGLVMRFDSGASCKSKRPVKLM